MSNKYFPDVVVPNNFPEPLKNKIREINRMRQEKRDLIDQEPIYDTFTKECIDEYIKSFQILYPNILTNEELYTRIKANLKEPIEIVDNLKDLDNKPQQGVFIPNKHQIKINKELIENNIITDQGKSTLFHELTHALVINNPFDIEQHGIQEDSNFIVESIVTIMQDDYSEKILHRKRHRQNTYIPTFAREIYSIFGKDLIKEYIIKFRDISKIFDEINEDNINYSYDILSKLSDETDEIYYSIIEKNDQDSIAYLSRNIELSITTILDHYLSSKDLSDSDKLDKIVELAKNQISPDFNLLRDLIKKHIKNKTLLEFNEYAKNIYYGPQKTETSNVEIIELRHKMNEFNACGLFGANEIIPESRFGFPKYKEYPYMHYQSNKKLYSALYELLNANKIDKSDLELTKILKTNEFTKDDLLDVREQLANVTSPAMIRIADILRFDETIYKCTTKDKSFYIKAGFPNELLRKGSLLDAINYYKELMTIGKDKEEIDTYKSAISILIQLVEKDVEEVYYSDTAFVYEYQGKTIMNESRYTENENGDDSGYFEDRIINMEGISLPEIVQTSSNQIGL